MSTHIRERPLSQPSTGAHPVIKRISATIYRVNLNGREVNISTARMKPALLEIDPDNSSQRPGQHQPSPSPIRQVSDVPGRFIQKVMANLCYKFSDCT